jgi:hypothetical protein
LTARGSGSRAALPVAKEVSHPSSEGRDNEPTIHNYKKCILPGRLAAMDIYIYVYIIRSTMLGEYIHGYLICTE